MKVSLFGKELFSTESRADYPISLSMNSQKESKYLPDFQNAMNNESAFYDLVQISGGAELAIPKKGKKVKAKKEKPKPAGPTPKGVYQARLLHDETFKLNTDEKYIESQLQDFKDKLALIKGEEYDMRRGTEEIASVVMRFENRKKYADHRTFYEQYPYTVPSRIADVLKKHDHLKLGQVAQFLADMPKEATDVMKLYEAETMKVCGKKPVFYIIADKKDFQKSQQRRDPILLAQSPFGHFWQILGAWDEEMLLLEEL